MAEITRRSVKQVKNDNDSKDDNQRGIQDLKTNKACTIEKEIKHLFPLLVVIRVINIFLVRTAFVPDEYWQTLEVAYHSTFGRGHLTWEWQVGLRSFAVPAVFSVLYRGLHLAGLDSINVMIFAPRMIPALVSATGDFYLYKFVTLHFGEKIGRLTLISNTLNWFWWYCSTRPIIQSTETTMLCIGLFYYPWKKSTPASRYVKYIMAAALICVIRPTAAITWGPLVLWHLVRELKNGQLLKTLKTYIVIFFMMVLLCASIDRIYYGKWVFVHWNFLLFNVLTNQGVYYGSNPWYYYITEGVAVLFGTHTIYFISGVVSTFKTKDVQNTRIQKCLLFIFCINMFVYSIVGHKEHRYILLLVPIASLFCGISLSHMSKRFLTYSLVFLTVTNIPLALYFGLVHQSGPMNIVSKLRSSVLEKCNPRCKGEILFLTPCCTTPIYSHLHLNVSTRYLTCPPNINRIEDYLDEADTFYQDPVAWLNENIFPGKVQKDKQKPALPHHIVMFDSLYEEIQEWKAISQYSKCDSSFHTHFPEGRVGRNFLLLCLV